MNSNVELEVTSIPLFAVSRIPKQKNTIQEKKRRKGERKEGKKVGRNEGRKEGIKEERKEGRKGR